MFYSHLVRFISLLPPKFLLIMVYDVGVDVWKKFKREREWVGGKGGGEDFRVIFVDGPIKLCLL